MNGVRFALLAALSLLVIFISANLVSNVWFRSWRLDLTENHLYSLSPGTKQVLDALNEPVQLTLYYSRDAATVDPDIQSYGARVREMLHSFAARSRGKVRFREVNVEPFTEAEDEAVEMGLQPATLYQGADPLYFGLSGVNAIDDRRTIPLFTPEREPFLEYEVTRLIYELENPDLTRVALITALPIDPAEAANPQFGPVPQSQFATEMGRLMNVTKLAPDFTEIPSDVDVLVVIHPPPLTPVQAFAIDQFVMRHGRAFIAVDPASMVANEVRGSNPFDPMALGVQTASSLEPMLSRWGVAVSPDVVLDLEGALPVNAPNEAGQTVQAPQPLFFRVTAEDMNREDLATAWLRRGVNFGLTGALMVSDREGVVATTLANTSPQTMRMPAAEAMIRPSPFEIMRMWPAAGGRIETIAVRLSGRLQSAFPEGAPLEAPPAADGSAPLAASAGEAQIVVVADTDFLDDAFYVDPQGGSFADNASFALNAIDMLGGSDALVSLRSRAPSMRTMEYVTRMEAEAQRLIERRQEELRNELTETETRLAELQRGGRGSGFFSGDLGAELTADENAEIDRFRNRLVEVRGELRGTERELRASIGRLEALVVFLNVWLAPLLVAGAGLFLFWRRQRRARMGGR